MNPMAGIGDRLPEFVAHYFVTIGHFFERLFEIHFTLGALAMVVLVIAALQLCFYLLLISLPVFSAEEFLMGNVLNAGIAALLWLLLLVLYFHDRQRPPGTSRMRLPWRRLPPAAVADTTAAEKSKGVGG